MKILGLHSITLGCSDAQRDQIETGLRPVRIPMRERG